MQGTLEDWARALEAVGVTAADLNVDPRLLLVPASAPSASDELEGPKRSARAASLCVSASP